MFVSSVAAAVSGAAPGIAMVDRGAGRLVSALCGPAGGADATATHYEITRAALWMSCPGRS